VFIVFDRLSSFAKKAFVPTPWHALNADAELSGSDRFCRNPHTYLTAMSGAPVRRIMNGWMPQRRKALPPNSPSDLSKTRDAS
jgi:hypothetical protein